VNIKKRSDRSAVSKTPRPPILLVAHLKESHQEGKTHREIDISLGDVPVQAFHEDRDSDGDQEREGQDLQGRMVQNKIPHRFGVSTLSTPKTNSNPTRRAKSRMASVIGNHFQ
jgi:hypothetical protein